MTFEEYVAMVVNELNARLEPVTAEMVRTIIQEGKEHEVRDFWNSTRGQPGGLPELSTQ